MYTKGLIIYIYRERERERERERHDIGVGIDNNDKASKELKEERSSGYLVGKRRCLVLRGLRKKYIYIYIYIYQREGMSFISFFIFCLVTS